MGIGRGNCEWTAQVPGVRCFNFQSSGLAALAAFESRETLHAVGGGYRRRDFHDGQPWYPPTHRTEVAGGAESTAVGAGVGGERIGGFFSVRVVFACGRDALCLLPGSVVCVWAGGQDLSDVYRKPNATRDRGAVDRGHFGCGDVELECGAELAVIEFDYGFLCSPSPDRRRSRAPAAGAAGNRRMGSGAVRPGGAGAASGRARGGSRVANRVGCLWGPTWRVSVGSADEARESKRGNSGHGRRTRD